MIQRQCAGRVQVRKPLVVLIAVLLALAQLLVAGPVFAGEGASAGFYGGELGEGGEPEEELEEAQATARAASARVRNNVDERMTLSYLKVSGTYKDGNDEKTIVLYEYDGEVLVAPEIVTLSDTRLDFSLNWEPDKEEFAEGDTFTIPFMQLSDIDTFSSQRGTLESEDGEPSIGTYQFIRDGKELSIQVTFNSNVTEYDSLGTGYAKGYVRFSSDAEEVEGRFRDQDSCQIFYDEQGSSGGQGGVYGVYFVKLEGPLNNRSGSVTKAQYDSLKENGLRGYEFEVRRVDANGQESEPLEFYTTGNGIYRYGPDESFNGEPTQLLTTSSEGTFRLVFYGDSVLDKYLLRELQSGIPEGFYGEQNQSFSFQPSENNSLHYAIYNHYRSVQVKKTNAVSGQALQGVEFALYRVQSGEDDVQVTGFTRLEDGRYSYDEIGSAKLLTGADGILEIRYLPAGSYYLVETAPLSGYLENTKKYDFVLEESTSKTSVEVFDVKNSPTGGGDNDTDTDSDGGGGRTPDRGNNGGEYRERNSSSGGGTTFTPSTTPPATVIPEEPTPLATAPAAEEGNDNPGTGLKGGVGVALVLAVAAGVTAQRMARKLRRG